MATSLPDESPTCRVGLFRPLATVMPGARTPALAGRAFVFAVLAALFVVLQMHHSLDQGPLAFPVTYDDSTYYFEGLHRLYLLYDAGIQALATDYVARAPHSTWSAAVAFVGFAMFGPVDWAPIGTNAIVLAVAAVGFAVATRDIAIRYALAIFLAVLSWRYTGHLAMEARPDMVWSLAVVSFAAIASRLAVHDLSRRWLAAGALLFALALISKMTTAPVTAAIAVTLASVILLLRRRSMARSWGAAARPLLWMLGAGALIALPVYLVSARTIAAYVYENVFGDRAGIWELQMSLADHALYHLSGIGGAAMMSEWLYLWIATLAICIVLVWRRKEREVVRIAAPFAAAFVMAFLAVTVPAHKSPHIGAVVPAFFLVSWIAMAVYLVRCLGVDAHGARRRAVDLIWLFPLVGIALFQWHATLRFGPNTPTRALEAQHHRDTVQRILADLERSGVIQSEAFVVGSAPYINAMTMRYYATQRRRPAPTFTDDLFSSDLEQLERRIATAAAVVVFSDDNQEVSRWLPAGDPGVQRHAAASLAALGSELESFRYPSLRGGEARMYVRLGQFHGIQAGQGLGPIEGPYPQWKLPVVRWGFGPASQITHPGSTAAAVLAIEAQSPLPDQVITVVVDGRNAGTLRFSKANEPEMFTLPLGVLAADSRITLNYAKWTEPSPADPRRMAVLFRKLQIRG